MSIKNTAFNVNKIENQATQKLVQQLTRFIPWNEQEQRDREVILSCLAGQPDVFLRTNLTNHMTASAWTINKTGDKILMVYHNIYHSWSWLGGHADGDRDLLAVAVREVQEESGIECVHPVNEDIFSLEVLTVDGHEKKGVYVPSHLHLNVTYLLEADENCPLKGKEDENSGAAWFAPDGAVAASTEPWFQERIYKKLNEKLAAVRTQRVNQQNDQ